jgi:hypothetical protein
MHEFARLFQVLLNEPRRWMDANDVESAGSHVLELVRSLSLDDEDVSGTAFDLLTIHGEARLAVANDPCLRVRMLVEIRTETRFVFDEKERHAGAVGLALERYRPCRTWLQLAPIG